MHLLHSLKKNLNLQAVQCVLLLHRVAVLQVPGLHRVPGEVGVPLPAGHLRLLQDSGLLRRRKALLRIRLQRVLIPCVKMM